MNILCISPVFVPIADSEAYCGAKMVLALQDCGADVTVLSKGSLQPPAERKVDNSTLWDRASKTVIELMEPSTAKDFISLFLGVKLQTVVYVRWVDALVRFAKELHTDKPFDVAYSRSLPMFAHIAGYWVSRTLNLPWIANINDPWDYHLFPNGRTSETSRIEAVFSGYWLKKTLKCADLITYPSDRLRDYVSMLGGQKAKGEIIPHIGYAVSGQKDVKYFNLVHAGKLGAKEWAGRPTEGLLQGCAHFLRENETARSLMKLTLVGPQDEATDALADKLGLSSIVRNLGRVSYEESLRHIGSATICVLVETDNTEGIYLPSKLADYIVARKPILALSPAVGVVADMAQDSGIIRVSGSDARSIAQAIEKLYKAFLNNSLHQYKPSDHVVRRFEPGPIADKLLLEMIRLKRDKPRVNNL